MVKSAITSFFNQMVDLLSGDIGQIATKVGAKISGGAFNLGKSLATADPEGALINLVKKLIDAHGSKQAMDKQHAADVVIWPTRRAPSISRR